MARHMVRQGEERFDPFASDDAAEIARHVPAGASPDETMQFVLAADESRRILAERDAAGARRRGPRFTPGAADAAAPSERQQRSRPRFSQAAAVAEAPARSEAVVASSSEEATGRSAAAMSVLVLISRITGFFRTWGQSSVLGISMIASCYSVANNLPNQLYELVVGGMLVTAFLPVYLSVKRRLGVEGASRYASNLVSLVTILMGFVAVLGMVFAAQLIWTQSFSANADFDSNLATFLFRFFVCEVILYSLSSVFSGILNAERDYVWSAAAPIFNNFVTTASFFVYAVLINVRPELAIFALAFGHPLGVFVQVVSQIPALRRRGIRIRPYVDLHDPAIKETLSIGIPSLVVVIASFATVSVQQSFALSVTAKGASVAYYARLWYTLPYAILAVPVTTTMFTELSICVANEDMDGYRRGITMGTNRILFFLVPFALYLIVFAPGLVGILGRFSAEDAAMTVGYLRALAVALPMYGVCMYLQKVCSSLRRMNLYAIASVIGSVVQVAFCFLATPVWGIDMVALSSLLLFVGVDVVTFASLRHQLGSIGVGSMLAAFLRTLVLGVAGAVVGALVLHVLLPGGYGAGMVRSLVSVIAGGIPAVLVTFGLALAFRVPEASFISTLLKRVLRR